MDKFEYQKSKFETIFKIQKYKLSELRHTWLKLFLSFIFRSFEFVSSLGFGVWGFKAQSGQALITLIFFVLIAVVITSGAIIMIAVNSLSVGKFQEGSISYYSAESGIENAILRILRNPSYLGETLTIDDSIVVVT